MKLSKMLVEALSEPMPPVSVVFQERVDGLVDCSINDVGATGTTPKRALAGALEEWRQISKPAHERAFMGRPRAREPEPEPDVSERPKAPLVDTLVALLHRAAAEMPDRRLRGAFESDLAVLLKEHGIELPAPARRESR